MILCPIVTRRRKWTSPSWISPKRSMWSPMHAWHCLLKKMEYYGIWDETHRWVRTCLTQRTQCIQHVQVDGSHQYGTRGLRGTKGDGTHHSWYLALVFPTLHKSCKWPSRACRVTFQTSQVHLFTDNSQLPAIQTYAIHHWPAPAAWRPTKVRALTTRTWGMSFTPPSATY